MGRARVVALVVYAILVATIFTPLYDALGRDSYSFGLVVFAAAHVGLGAGVRHAAAFALPVAVALASAIVTPTVASWSLILYLELPLAFAAVAAGWGLAALLRRRSVAVAALAFLVAAASAGWAMSETVERARAPHLPKSVQAQLPLDMSLGNLCTHAETPPRVRRDLRRRAEVLLRELRRRPDWLVTYTFVYTDPPDEERRDVTVRELAEEHLSDLESGETAERELAELGVEQGHCAPDLQRSIRAALE